MKSISEKPRALTSIISFVLIIILSAAVLIEVLDLNLLLSQIIFSTTLLFVVIIINRKKLFDDLETINKKSIIYGILAGLFGLIISFVWIKLIIDGLFPVQEYVEDVFKEHWLVLMSPFLLMAPLYEEVVMRANLRVLCKNKIIYIIISALLLWLFHLSLSLGSLIYIFLGIIYAMLYLKTENIFAPIIAHFINNLIVFIFLMITFL